jgi:hypothetical protein
LTRLRSFGLAKLCTSTELYSRIQSIPCCMSERRSQTSRYRDLDDGLLFLSVREPPGEGTAVLTAASEHKPGITPPGVFFRC